MKLYLQSRAILDFRVLRFVLHCLMSIIQKSRLNHVSKLDPRINSQSGWAWWRANQRRWTQSKEISCSMQYNSRGHDFAYRKRTRRKGDSFKFNKISWPLQRKCHFKIQLCGRLCVLSSAQVMCSVRSPSDGTSISHTSRWNQPLSE